MLHTSLKVKRNSFDHFASEFNGVSSQSIRNVCERLAAGSATQNHSNMSQEEQRVLKLMKEVNAITSNVPGSSASRVAMRNEIRSLIMEKGLPSFYITLNFADVYNPLVKFLAGTDIDIDNLLPEEVPNFMEQSILIAKNPTIAARFFNIYMKAFIKSILRFDPTGLDEAGGIFGHVNAYYGCVEAQGRGTLHCHMIIWLDGSLNCDEIRERVLANDQEFQQCVINFIDDTISNEIPIPDPTVHVPSDDAHPCALRGLNKSVQEDQVAARRKDMYNLIKSCQSHRHSATCFKYWRGPPDPKECRFDLGEHRYRGRTEFNLETGELQMRCLDGLVNNFNHTILEAIRCNMDIKFMGSGPSTKAVIYYITDYITKAQLKAHVAYAALELAVKKLNTMDPADDIPTTRAKRLLQKCAYSMISQQELSAQQVMSYLLDLEDHFTSHHFQNLYWLNFEQYVKKHLPLVTENGTHDSEPDLEESHALLLESDMEMESEPLDESEHDEVRIGVTVDGHLIPRTSQIRDYIDRGPPLAHLSLWEYTSCIEKVTKTRSRQTSSDPSPDSTDSTEIIEANQLNIILEDQSRNRPKFPFIPTHPESETHIQQIRHPRNRPLPTLIGPPVVRRDQADNLLRYHRLMLIFFKPWIIPQDLLGPFDNFTNAFTNFVGANNRWNKIMDNMQILHECRDSRDDHFEARSHARQSHTANENSRARNLESDDFAPGTSMDISMEILDHLNSMDSCRSDQISRNSESIRECLTYAEKGGIFDKECPNGSSENSQNDMLSDCDPIEPLSETYEAEWKYEYDQRRQAWKSQILTNQNQSTLQQIPCTDITLNENSSTSIASIPVFSSSTPLIAEPLNTNNMTLPEDQNFRIDYVRCQTLRMFGIKTNSSNKASISK